MFSLKLFSAALLSTFLILPSYASESEKLTRILEYVQSLDERITKLEAELKTAGRSNVVSGSKIALGGWVNPSAWNGVEMGTHYKQVLGQLGEPTSKERDLVSEIWTYEGTINGRYLLGYVEIMNKKVILYDKPDF